MDSGPCICGRGIEFTDGHAAYCNLPVVTERNGLTIGDRVSVGGIPYTVDGFAGSECDVVLRAASGSRVTFCCRHREVVKANA